MDSLLCNNLPQDRKIHVSRLFSAIFSAPSAVFSAQSARWLTYHKTRRKMVKQLKIFLLLQTENKLSN